MLVGDDPVGIEGDRLNRGHIAQRWAGVISDVEPGSSIVFAINGPWGSGKTSVLTMIEEHLNERDRKVLRFNPWLFSGTDQLIGFFFSELAAQLDVNEPKAARIAQSMKSYGALFTAFKIIPIIGTSVAGAGEATAAAGKLIEAKQNRGIEHHKKDLEEALRELESPLTVFLDDIDRLTGSEIREILRMVRLTASLPNLLYVLAFDRHRVESALGEDGVSGRAYLEKIVQVAFDVPMPTQDSLREILFSELNELLGGLDGVRFSEVLWLDVFIEIIEPLISNIRDVRRFIAPLRSTVDALDNQIELVDVLALEAIRIFLPDSFAVLREIGESLTTTRAYGARATSEPESASELERFISSSTEHEKELRSVCQRLFPASLTHLGEPTFYGPDSSRTWLKERRVANGAVLGYYLTQFLPEELDAITLAEKAFLLFEDRDSLERFLTDLSPTKAESVIASLENLEEHFGEVDPTNAIVVLLEQVKRLHRPAKGFLDISPRLVVARVVIRLLRPVSNEDDRVRIIETSLGALGNPGAKFLLLKMIERKERPEEQLIPEEKRMELLQEVKSDVRSATADDLAKSPDLLIILWQAGEGVDGREWIVDADFLQHGSFAVELLRSSISTNRSQTLTSRFVHHTDVIAWDTLSAVLGGEAAIRVCRDSAAAILGASDETIVLVDQYLSGWRPPSFGD